MSDRLVDKYLQSGSTLEILFLERSTLTSVDRSAAWQNAASEVKLQSFNLIIFNLGTTAAKSASTLEQSLPERSSLATEDEEVNAFRKVESAEASLPKQPATESF